MYKRLHSCKICQNCLSVYIYPVTETHTHLSKIMLRCVQDTHLCLSRNEFPQRAGWTGEWFCSETYPNHVTVFSVSRRKRIFSPSWVFLSKSIDCSVCWLGVHGNRCFHAALPEAPMQIQLQKAWWWWQASAGLP